MNLTQLHIDQTKGREEVLSEMRGDWVLTHQTHHSDIVLGWMCGQVSLSPEKAALPSISALMKQVLMKDLLHS